MLSIVIPTLNEEQYLARCLASVRPLGMEIVVADGGSADATAEIARNAGARVIEAPRGRGMQLHAGAEASHGETILFLHADSRLSADAVGVLGRVVADPGFRIGTFRLRFDSPRPLCRLYAWFSRFDSLWTSFGDQGIVVRRSFYRQLGGFPAWTVLEDVELLRRARRLSRIRSLPAEVTTSARRFEMNGMIRQQARNAVILLRYLLGTSPGALAALYAPSGPNAAVAGGRISTTAAHAAGIPIEAEVCADTINSNPGG